MRKASGMRKMRKTLNNQKPTALRTCHGGLSGPSGRTGGAGTAGVVPGSGLRLAKLSFGSDPVGVLTIRSVRDAAERGQPILGFRFWIADWRASQPRSRISDVRLPKLEQSKI